MVENDLFGGVCTFFIVSPLITGWPSCAFCCLVNSSTAPLLPTSKISGTRIWSIKVCFWGRTFLESIVLFNLNVFLRLLCFSLSNCTPREMKCNNTGAQSQGRSWRVGFIVRINRVERRIICWRCMVRKSGCEGMGNREIAGE